MTSLARSSSHSAERLIVLEGMPGAGKTTLARALAAEGAAVISEYTTPAGATIPATVHPDPADDTAHDTNWTRKAAQATTALSGGAAVYADRDWLTALAYAYSIADADHGQLLARRCTRIHRQLARGELLLPGAWVIFHVSTATSLRRRAGRLDRDHPWSRPRPLARLGYFYNWPAQAISTAHPGLATALLGPDWHRAPAASPARLRLLHQLGAAS